MIIDTHCHLIDEAFAGEVDAVIARAKSADVQKIVLACCDESEFLPILDLSRHNPDVLYPTVGIHPENMADDIAAQFDKLFSSETLANALPEIKAVGEIGLDLHWDKTRFDDQCRLLVWQMDWALANNFPVLLHIRDAMPQFLDLCRGELKNIGQRHGKPLRGILHCYSGTVEDAWEAIEYGDFLIGVGGTLTYKKSLVADVARAVGLDRIVLETDAPYLAPVPHRGHRNEPAYTADTCRALADALGFSADEVARRTTSNARRMLGL